MLADRNELMERGTILSYVLLQRVRHALGAQLPDFEQKDQCSPHGQRHGKEEGKSVEIVFGGWERALSGEIVDVKREQSGDVEQGENGVGPRQCDREEKRNSLHKLEEQSCRRVVED